MNLNISSEQQRVFLLIGVGILAVAGLFLVTRGGAGPGGGATGKPPAKTSPAKPGSAKPNPPKSAQQQGGASKQRSASKEPSATQRTPDTRGGGREQSAAKPSKQAYLSCVERATDTAALERCQAVLP